MLPLRARLIHCRWSGESTWIPYGDLRPDVGWEHHTSHPAPGHLALYPGGISECEIFFPYGVVHDVVEGRPAGRQPLRDRPARRGLGGPAARGRPAVPLGGRPGDRDHRDARLTRGGPRRPRRHRRHGGRLAGRRRRGRGRPDHGDRAGPVGPAATAREVVDATGLLVLPGVVDVHTHTRVASDAEPDRFFQDSVAAAFGGTTTFLSFNNPGTGSSPAAARSLAVGLREWQAATAADAAVDVGLSLVVTADQPDAAGGDAGRDRGRACRRSRRSWSTTSGSTTRRCSGRWRRPASAAACSRSTARTGRSSRR